MTSEISSLNITTLSSINPPTVIATTYQSFKLIISGLIITVSILLLFLCGLITYYYRQKMVINAHEHMIEMQDLN